ncbi:LMBR1 domain-containing protein 2 [Hypsibius exemplaris]|uniref:LMBR1 domain-containing protein 2 n=1 Tax=Hypsibius exemplaris TaxID=2072580 RepID=A0A1W0WWN5_HYPEX|nr:LMBR1 domain-containing protein 2 [Hypsibius exemplaris]
MAALVLGLELILVFLLTLLVLNEYGNWRTQHPIVTVAVFVAWYFSFLIIFIIPMDVSATLYQQCLNATVIPNITEEHFNISDPLLVNECEPPWSYVDPHVLPTLWRVLYWTCQFLSWLLLPLMQSYALAGEFSVGGKLLASLKRNAIYYGTYLLVFGVLLIYVAAKPELHLSWSRLYTLIVTASNTWGLFLLILLLGHGLVDIPRGFWRASSLSFQLAYTQFKLAKVATEKAEADEELDDVLGEVKKAADYIDARHSLRPCLELIISKCPGEIREKLSEAPKTRPPSSTTATVPTQGSLVMLHKRLISAIHRKFRTSSSWLALLEDGFELEDCIRNQPNGDRTFRPTFPVARGQLHSMICTPRIEWFWKCLARQWILKAVAVIIVIFAVMVVWSECTFFVVEPVLSLFAIFVTLAGYHREYFNVELASFFIIAFLSICTYRTVFKIRFFNYYHFAPRHQTDENSLIFGGTLLCRLTPPMCLNFLSLIHMDSHIIKTRTAETAFTRIMGHLDVLPIISEGFNIYFPMLILVLCLATYFRLGTRILNFFGFQQFVDNDDLSVDLVNEGRELMQRERRKRLRAEDTKNRREQLMELVNNTSNFGRVSRFSRREHALSKKGARDSDSGTGSGLRYKNFHNDEPSTASEFGASISGARSSSTLRSLERERQPVSYDLGSIQNESLGQDFRATDRNYQSLSSESANPNASSQFGYPPRNLFDDV